MAAIRQAGGPGGRGVFRFTWNGGRITSQINSAMTEAMRQTAVAVRANAQRRARVRTGRMRAGVQTAVTVAGGRRTMRLSDRVLYTPYVEARFPFLAPAIREEIPKFRARFKAAMARIS